MARIAAGFLKGQVLVVPRHIRATADKVRQALFNILGGQIADARVIDGFAGSGALGLEALSRGARLVVFLESHPACVNAIERNLARIHPGTLPGRWRVMRGDALRSLQALARKTEPFDLLLLDPPYEGSLGEKALNVVATCGMLAPTSIVCVEHVRRHEPPSAIGPLILMTRYRYGDTVLSVYRVGRGQASQTARHHQAVEGS